MPETAEPEPPNAPCLHCGQDPAKLTRADRLADSIGDRVVGWLPWVALGVAAVSLVKAFLLLLPAEKG